MIIAKLPFERFLEFLRRSGREQGFVFLMIFIAREADCPQVFRHIEKAWSSLHDWTGSEILFLTVDGTTSFPSPVKEYSLRDDVGFIRSREGVIYSPECRLLQCLKGEDIRYEEYKNIRYEEYKQYEKYTRNVIDFNTRPTRRDPSWRDEQTLGISNLLSALAEVKEDGVPCLYFESLQCDHKFSISIKLIDSVQLSIYELLKLTSSKTKPHMFKIKENSTLRKNLLEAISSAEMLIKSLTPKPSSAAKKFLHSKSWLEEWCRLNESSQPEIAELINLAIAGNLETNKMYSGIKHLREVFDPRSFLELRSHLNRIVDCSHLLEEILDLEKIRSANQKLIEGKQKEIQESNAQILQSEKSIAESSRQIEDVIKRSIQDQKAIIQNKSRQIVEESKTVVYAEKYYENLFISKTSTNMEIPIMSGDRHINTGGGNYIESNPGTYIQGNYINMNQDLTQAATQIQDLLDQLQQRGVSVDTAQEQVAKDMANQAQKNPTLKNKLVKWGQSLGDATVNDVVKGVVKLAIRSAGIPLP